MYIEYRGAYFFVVDVVVDEATLQWTIEEFNLSIALASLKQVKCCLQN
jgi:hypothetical protein